MIEARRKVGRSQLVMLGTESRACPVYCVLLDVIVAVAIVYPSDR